MTSLKIEFEGAQGAPLAARLETPETPRAFALFAHCFTCGKDSSASVRVSRALALRGVAVLRFDFTGLGGSGGDFSNTNFSSSVADLVAAADHLRRAYEAPALLIGHSLGGAAAIAAAAHIPEARALVTIGAPSDAAHVEHSFLDRVAEIERSGKAQAVLGGRHFTIRRQLLEDLRGQRQQQRIADLRCALLVMHAPTDAVVGIDNASRIFGAARHPKSFVSLDDADHFLIRAADADYAAGVIAAWAARYLPKPTAREAQGAADGAVLVEETGAGLFQRSITIGPHRLIADEPAAAGGLDAGPDPYGLLAAALGACKSMTARLYAERKNWPLEKISVRIAHDRVHARDCADCETREGGIDEFRVEVELMGDLDPAQRKRLVEIADRCPVHQTLQGEVKIRTTASRATVSS